MLSSLTKATTDDGVEFYASRRIEHEAEQYYLVFSEEWGFGLVAQELHVADDDAVDVQVMTKTEFLATVPQLLGISFEER